MTAVAIWELVKRFWFAVPIAGLLIALMLTRGSLANVKHERDIAKGALAITAANYVAAANERKASDLVNVARVQNEGGAISKEELDGYNERVADLRADFARRVRLATGADPGRPGSADLPGVPLAASGADAPACEAKLPASDALTCSEIAEQLIALQAWNRRTAVINVNGASPNP